MRLVPASPQILAVDHRHRHGIEIEIIQQPRIDPNSRILEIGLAGRPVRRFGIGAATATGTEMVFDRTALPLIGRDVLYRRGQAKLRRCKVSPERAALRAQRAGAARHAAGLIAQFEPGVAAMAASIDRHGLILSISRKAQLLSARRH